jgi:ubiquinone/menaquinone biosynthesis C-methylase UbiE
MSIVGKLHASSVFPRRVQRLGELISTLLPRNATVLDVGSGDGSIAAMIMSKRPDVRIEGIDVLVRPEAKIPTKAFDGRSIPFPDASFEIAMFVDVLHHTDCPGELIREAARVSSKGIVIKDHLLHGVISGATLRLMDYVGNAHHGVRLPYNYLAPKRWEELYRQARLKPDQTITKLQLYPWPASIVFDANLHFISALQKV